MKILNLMLIIFTVLTTSFALAKQGDVYIYPANQQTAEQSERDRYECYVWASGESGFDPAAENTPQQARVVRVAVNENPNQGATIAGTIIGAIAGAALDDRRGHGVAVGAGVGAMIGAGVEQQGQRKVEAEARQAAQEIAASNSDHDIRMASYRRAFSACLEGRGYVVR